MPFLIPKTSAAWVRLVALLLVLWAVLIIRMDAPWYGIQEAPRLWVPAGVRNYDLYGVQQTGLMVIRNIGPTTPDQFTYYPHHPPTIIWLPALITRFTGFNELGVRYGFVAVTLLSAAALYVLVRRLYGEQVAWWATAFYGLMPIVAYYGRVPGHDQIGLLVVFLFAAVLVNWLRRPTRVRFFALAALSWMAVWSAWTAVFFVGMLGLAAMFLGQWRHRRAVVVFGIVSVIAFLVMIAFYQSQYSGSIESILRAFFWRSSNASDAPASEAFTLWEFIAVTLTHSLILMTIGLLVMSIWGAFVLARRGTHFSNGITLTLLLGALVYQLVFRNASYVHDYYKITFAPVVAISAAMVWVTIGQSDKSRLARPLLIALLLITVIMGAGVLALYHGSGNRPWITAVTTHINTLADDDDRIMTHLEGKDYLYPLEFYTFRNIQQAATLQDALQTTGMGHRVIYIYCPQLSQTAAIDLPPEANVETHNADQCQVLSFIPR